MLKAVGRFWWATERTTWARWVVLVALGVTVGAMELAAAALAAGVVALAMGQALETLPVIPEVLSTVVGDATRARAVAFLSIAATFFMFRLGIALLQSYLQLRVTTNAGTRLASRLAEGHLRLPFEHHFSRSTGEMVRLMHEAPDLVSRFTFYPLILVITEIFVASGLVIALVVMAPVVMVFISLSIGVLMIVITRLINPRMVTYGSEHRKASQEALKILNDIFGGLRDIILSNAPDRFIEAYRIARRSAARALYMQGAFSNAPRLIVETAAILLLLGLAASTYLGGGSAGSALLPGFLIYAVLRLAPSSSRVLGALSHLSFGLAAMEEIEAALNTIDATNTRTTTPVRRVPEPFCELRFDEVGFTYRTADEVVVPTLDSVSFRISRGEFVGIVGATGSGKTTILDLLLGLLTPQEGQILLNSRSLASCTQEWWAMVGVVSQDVFVLSDSVAANVAFGVELEAIDHQRVWRALDLAQLGDAVRSMPARLDSELGERGIAISGGERQRVGIARALYHMKEVLVLDEATSALDTATEVRLLTALREEMRGRSLIMVTHRIEALRTFDRIIMVENGTVVTQGTYDALEDRSPSFQALIRSAD